MLDPRNGILDKIAIGSALHKYTLLGKVNVKMKNNY